MNLALPYVFFFFGFRLFEFFTQATATHTPVMTMHNNTAKLATIAIAIIEPLESEGEPWLLGGVVGEGDTEGIMSVDGQGVGSGGSE